MKKLCAILLICLLGLGCAVTAFGDAASPYFSELEGYVQKTDGVPLMDYNNQRILTIPYGTKLKITGVYNYDGNRKYQTSYQGEYGQVTEDGVTVDLSPVSPEGHHALAREHHMVVNDPNGVLMHVGPGEFYDSVGKRLPYGAEIICTHNNIVQGKEDASGLPSWEYGACNGQSGWVEIDWGNGYNKLVELVRYGEPNSGRGLTGSVTVMKSGERLSKEPYGEEIGPEIPVGTTLSFEKYHGSSAIVTYAGVTGWLSLSSEMILEEKGTLYISAANGAPLYRTAGDLSSKTESVLPFGTIIDISAAYTQWVMNSKTGRSSDTRDWYRVRFNGKDLWARFDDRADYDLGFGEGAPYRVTAKDGVRLYEQPDRNSASAGTLAKGAVVLQICSHWDGSIGWQRLTADGAAGWYRGDMETAFVPTTLAASASKPAPTSARPTNAAAATTAITAVTATETSKFSSEAVAAPTTRTDDGAGASAETTAAADLPAQRTSPRMIIFACASAAVILALVAAITIVLIKKRRTE